MQAGSVARRAGWVTAVAVAVAAQVACGTSDRQAETEDQSPAAAAADAVNPTAEVRVNLTGCMERGTIPGSFVLTHASTEGTGQTEGATGTAGTEGATAATGTVTTTYTVRSEDGTDLGKYVGKRVALSGRFATVGDQSGTGTSGTAASPGVAPGVPGVPGSRGSTPGTVGSGADASGSDSTAATAGPNVVPTRQVAARDVREVSGTCSGTR
jgi:hypothetical protein